MSYSDLIAVQVLTHNHANVVADVLEKCAEHYKRCGIEIYYYDSSTNDETRRIICDYNEKGYDNLIYVPLEPDTSVYSKRDMVYSGYAFNRDYKYVWISKDRAYVEESALMEILEAAEQSFDVIVTASREGDKTIIDSAEELYYRWAPISSSMNSVILNRFTILDDYVAPVCSDDTENCYLMDFGHYYTLFEKLSRMNQPKIARIDMRNRIHNSDLEPPTWEKRVFTIWKDRWIAVNDALPEIYDPYKEYIIKKVAGLPWILAERERLLQLHDMGVLTPETLPHALDGWERISDIPKEVVMDIANGTYDIRYDLTQIQDRNDTTRILVEMIGYVADGRMAKEQIPLDDLATAIKMEVAKDEDKARVFIRIGAVASIIDQIKNEDVDRERLARLLQELIAYII
ncbi:MAG: hypothetical protein K6E68_05885 [Lachnospiraceae bacterium]|nr:hypothetical protein [Lachnospiraceae bacterium]